MKRLRNPMMVEYLKEAIENKTVEAIQTALRMMGEKVEVDGEVGNLTILAIKRVRNSKLIKISEQLILGENEVESTNSISLEGEYKKKTDYLLEASKYIGLTEHEKESNYFHQRVGMKHWSAEDVPWCGSFVGAILKDCGFETPNHPYRALAWLEYAKESTTPEKGCIAVKRRKGGGHVCFVVNVSENGNEVMCLGGNQGDKVCTVVYKTNEFESFRKITEQESKYFDKTEKSLAGKES